MLVKIALAQLKCRGGIWTPSRCRVIPR